MPETLKHILNNAVDSMHHKIFSRGIYKPISKTEIKTVHQTALKRMLTIIPEYLPECQLTNYEEIPDSDIKKFLQLADSLALAILSEHCVKKTK